MNAALYITEQIIQAGIPIYGVAYAPHQGQEFRIDFTEDATDAQKALGQQIGEQAIADLPKVQLKQKANDDAGIHINEFYALYRQINISRLAQDYTQADLDKMSTFIDAVRDRCHQYEAEIQAGQTPVIDYTDITPV
jgi:hypothetical protein